MLHIISGPDRTQNTAALMQLLCQKARAHVAGQIMIVPEQYSHETERALCACGGDSISRWAEVLSFSRLATRAFGVYGGVCEEYLDENGRILTLYLAAQQVREQLKYFAAVMRKPEFLRQLGAFMEELMTSCVAPQALFAAAGQLSGRLAQKVTELALLYESYLSICKTGRGDPVTRQLRLLELLDETELLDGREVYLDGFSDFTALQTRLVAAILAHAANVYIAVTTDGGTQAASQTGNETQKRLEQLAARQGIAVVKTRQAAGTFRAPDVQQWLTGLFFGGSGSEQAPKGVELVHAQTVQQACQWAARRVRDGAAQGLRYRDFTICLASQELYEHTMKSLFARAGIPVYSAGSTPVLHTPLASALLDAMQAITRYEPGPMLSFLKSAYSPLSAAQADLLEQYVHYWDVRGLAWEKPWQLHPRGLGQALLPEDTEQLSQLNELRELAVAPLRRLRLAMAQSKHVGEQVRAVAAFWEAIDVCGCLRAESDALAAAGQVQDAQTCAQLYEALICALEQLEQVLGRTEMDTELFVQLFSMLLSNTSIGTIPSVCDAVQLTTLPMLRHRRSAQLIVLGADDGALPAFTEPGGLLADGERRTLRALGVELSAARQTVLDREMSWVCAALSAAEQSAALVSAAEQPSFLYTRTQTLFPALCVQNAADAAFYPDCAAAAAAALRHGGALGALPPAVQQQGLRLRAHCGYGFAQMRPAAVQALYGKTVPLSASKLDTLAGCRFAFFMQYGLQAKPWKQAEFDAPLFGSFVHEVLEHVVRQVRAEGGFAVISDERLLALTRACMEESMRTWLPPSAAAHSRESYLSARNRQEAEAVVLDVARELRRSHFAPVAEELKFAPDGALGPIEYRCEAGRGLLTGYIDRVDTCELDGKTYFRVVDYKTGHKDFSYTELLYGKNMQMLLYLFALQKNADAALCPAGVLYVPGRCDMVRLEPGEAADAADAARRKLLRRKGLVLRDERVVRAMEAFDQSPEYLPVGCKQGELIGDLASPAQLAALERFVTGQVEVLLSDLLSGKTAPDPADHGPADSACRWCDYACACHKDVCPPQTRRFAAVRADEFWQEVERRQSNV